MKQNQGKLVCSSCRATYPLSEPLWRCACGSPLDIDFQPVFDLKYMRQRQPGLWRYRQAIPLEDDSHIVSLGETVTPLVEIECGGRRIQVKQEQLSPSGSFKDRGAAVLISKARELGIAEVIEDSSGNAGCAIAAYCARAHIACRIYVPDNAPAAKLNQMAAYGAELRRVSGSRQEVAAAALVAARNSYYASHCWNPFFFQGTKTFAYRLCEQLGWRAPDILILPVGNGTLLLGAWLGFNELLQAGRISRLPRLVAVQAAACAPLAEAWKRDLADVPPVVPGPSAAGGIAIARPLRGRQILEAIRRSRGEVLSVSEEEIGAAGQWCGRRGFYIEPTAAATVAGVLACVGRISEGEVLAAAFTGHGLKAG